MVSSIPEFGTATPGVTYTLRPGGYAVIFDAADKVAVVSTPAGLFLPGGGQDGEEPAEQATLREVAEECGLQIKLGSRIGVADEMVVAKDDGKHYRKRCTFFLAEVVGWCEPLDSDHELIWLSPRDALTMLIHDSARWAIAEACRWKGRQL